MTDDKKDLTRIEGLSAFLHEEDPEVENFFRALKEQEQKSSPAIPDLSLDELEQSEPAPVPVADTADSSETTTEEAPADNSEEPTETTEIAFAEGAVEESSEEQSNETPFSVTTETSELTDSGFTLPESSEETTFDGPTEFAVEAPPILEDSPAQEDSTISNENDLSQNNFQALEAETTSQVIEPPKNEKSFTSSIPTEPKFTEQKVSESKTNGPQLEKLKVETFQDVKEFANLMAIGDLSGGGNPPFSLVIRNILFQDECQDILIILKEHGLVKTNDEEQMLKSLQRGSLLLSQLSEYAIIVLAHKLRRFHLDLFAGLSDEIHPPKEGTTKKELLPSYYKGLTSKHSLYQNQNEHIDFESFQNNPEQILISTTNTLPGLQIVNYLGIATEYTLVDEEDFMHQEAFVQEIKKTPKNTSPGDKLEELDHLIESLEKTIDNAQKKLKSASLTPLHLRLEDVYANMANKLKVQALKLKGNAVIGINYQITPLMADEEGQIKGKYKVICTGNVVWAVKI